MPRALDRRTVSTLLVLLFALPTIAMDVEIDTYTLPNGLTVILHTDHTLPQVTINTWFAVGSKDEPPGRSGFAHLFEHLMFMGTERVPGSQYDLIMEGGGGTNNASTNTDRTNYYSWGPSSLLPTLLWLDADRLDGLGRAMTQEKLDLQREVVRNERRQNYENTPYNQAYLIVPSALYPVSHPYHHSTIGNHADLEAATLPDVKEFFATYYVPGNATLVVAGDFEPDVARRLIASTFGAVEPRPLPPHSTAAPPVLEREVRRMALDRVESPRLYLVWPSPPSYDAGDAEMDLLADILAGGPSSRLHRRLVIEEGLARDVSAFQWSKELGSEFWIDATAVIGGDLEKIKRIVIEEIARLQREGPTAAELARVTAALEADFLREVENLVERADMINGYRHYFGDGNGFDRDLDRYRAATADGVQRWAARVLGDGRVDLRILPEDGTVEGANLDQRPGDLAAADFEPPLPATLNLSNGLPVHYVHRPGSGLFSGALIVDGGERLVPPDQAGLASLAATMLTAGAGGRDASALADAIATLGASVDAAATWHDVTVTVSGLASKLDETLDLYADVVLRPNLTAEDFSRERRLALDDIRSRTENAGQVAFDVARVLMFGADDPRGRPAVGYQETVERLPLATLQGTVPRLLDPANARFVFVGDVSPDDLRSALEKRFGDWTSTAGPLEPLPPSVTEPAPGHMVLVDRPGAPQTFLVLARPLPPPSDATERAARSCVNNLFGGSFMSRINANLREQHGFTYGAFSVLSESANQHILYTYSSVQTEVTAAALAELEGEFKGLASGDVTREELDKALRTVRQELVTTSETTDSLAATLQTLLSNGRPLDAVSTAIDQLGRLDLERAHTAARSGLYSWDSLLVVMVGPASQLLPQLTEAGLATPVQVDERGRPIEGD